jgi:pyruvate/2-oxoglutarate dehydrogenase complex dihydrolipoamide acyltransferase (E2) component
MSIFEPASKRTAQGPLVLVLALIAAGGVWIWSATRPKELQTAPPAAPPAPLVTPTAAPTAAAAPAPPPVSPAAQQALLEAVSANPLLRALIARGDLAHRWAVVASNLAEGETPRRELSFLAPPEPFSSEPSGTADIISPKSYQRYDAFADAVASVDAPAFARVYRALHPALDAAWRSLGGQGASLDAVAVKALRRIEQAPVETNPVLIDKVGRHWVFEASRLEALGPVEKHLLRMGPRNTRLLQAKAAELNRALGLAGPGLAGHPAN